MEFVDVEFVFVVYIVNFVIGDADEIFGEICVGFGEILVGNDVGSVFGFMVSKIMGEVMFCLFLSKFCGYFVLFGGIVIARSDSNGEDLENFVGVGFYDSIIVEFMEECVVDYIVLFIVWNFFVCEVMIRWIFDIVKLVESYRGSS